MNTPHEFQEVVKSVMEAEESNTCVLPVVAEIINACFSKKSAEDLVEHGNELRGKLGSRLSRELTETFGSDFENKVNLSVSLMTGLLRWLSIMAPRMTTVRVPMISANVMTVMAACELP